MRVSPMGPQEHYLLTTLRNESSTKYLETMPQIQAMTREQFFNKKDNISHSTPLIVGKIVSFFQHFNARSCYFC